MKALVAVELQLRSDSLFLLLHCQPDRIQNKIDCLPGGRVVGHNAVVVQITDHGQMQYTFLGVDIRNICDPFAVRSVSMELPFQQIMNRAISFKTQLFFYLPMAHPRLYHLFNYRR